MGFCFSKCLPESDMATELEAELDESNLDLANSKSVNKGSGSSALLASGEVACLSLIGQGASGSVYKGSYRGSVVAVKKMTMTGLPDNPSRRRSIETSLELEASRMGGLRHPNIVLFMGAYMKENQFCIVSEYCTRGSLYDVIHVTKKKINRSRNSERNKNVLSTESYNEMQEYWKNRVRLALGAARGLLFLHSADLPLVHGQLKSTNILVDDSWNAKLADFGTRRVAKAVGGHRNIGANGNTKDKLYIDCQLYRWTAPELLRSSSEKKKFNPSSMETAQDIYSFGMVLWELTSDEVPYHEETTNKGIYERVLSGERPVIQSNSCSIKWAELITRCWAQDPSSRPSAGEVVSTLEEILNSGAMNNIPMRIGFHSLSSSGSSRSGSSGSISRSRESKRALLDKNSISTPTSIDTTDIAYQLNEK